MLNWIKFLFLFLLTLGITVTLIVFYQAERPFADAQNTAKKAVLKHEVLKNVQKTDHYHGKNSWVTVYGTDEKNQEKVIFVEEKTTKILKAVSLKSGITEQKATDIVKKEKGVKKILRTSLGLEGEAVFWEVSYLTEDDSLNYAYLNFADGKWQKRIMKL
ncbi:hypothetical protein SporoP37_15585 [Sporosarcina sp. P37]|uniref:cell wall elongation regulator TseB-like domain-containing protein n=1 Tax=unclassified Sporosarcina TaxID=2647733 RepID=UPI0009BFB1FF|nr:MULTISPECIES: DUF5590 domain-containing protein [unclassified Sporosarcina]ARD49476.1 hypothetical protein SporoP33_15250 [Sporosarcina sp. P33]ARK25951.1 hypothetical protein SporoP37_15585 [Sporosarcina sp. P37]PID18228.1 hypothetical protein CSV62_09145 [Sporosarcina sp. P35]